MGAVQPERPLSATTPCTIENLVDLPPNVDYPPDAVAAGFSTSLDTAIVQDIVKSLLDQVPDADMSLRLRALEYYWVHDAFLELGVDEA